MTVKQAIPFGLAILFLAMAIMPPHNSADYILPIAAVVLAGIGVLLSEDVL